MEDAQDCNLLADDAVEHPVRKPPDKGTAHIPVNHRVDFRIATEPLKSLFNA